MPADESKKSVLNAPVIIQSPKADNINSFIKTLAAASLASFCTLASAQFEPVVLKFTHFLPPQAMVPPRIIKPWCEKIEKESAGRMRCEIYPAMQLGGTPAQIFDQVRDGVADIGWAVPVYTPGRFVSLDVFELPLMGTSKNLRRSGMMWAPRT